MQYSWDVLAIRRTLRSLALLALLSPVAALAASTITGTVTNRTTGRPSAGDVVTLIQLAQGMQESTHTTTDARGHYSLDVPDAGLHLVRVTHDKANYFGPAPAGVLGEVTNSAFFVATDYSAAAANTGAGTSGDYPGTPASAARMNATV